MSKHDAPVPVDSLIFGYGPMLPFVAAALGAWLLPGAWPSHAIGLAVIWGGLILAFLAGVRRGYGFGNAKASTPREIVTMIIYFVPAGLAVVCGWIGLWLPALVLLAVGYTFVLVLDRLGAEMSDVPAHFARLRPPQMAVAVVSLVILILRLVIHA